MGNQLHMLPLRPTLGNLWVLVKEHSLSLSLSLSLTHTHMQANIHMHTPCSTVQLLGNSLTHYCLTHHWANPLGFSQGTHTFSHVHTHKYTHTLAHKDVIPVLHDGPFPTFFPIVGQLVAELAVGGVGGHQAGPRALAGVARRGGHGRQGRARLLIQQQHPAATACVISNLLSSSSLITPPHFPLFFLPPPPPPFPYSLLSFCFCCFMEFP